MKRHVTIFFLLAFGALMPMVAAHAAMSSVTIASSRGGLPSLATNGDTVNLTFTSDVPLPWFAVNWTIAGHPATLPGGNINLHDNTWEAHLHVKAADADGPVGFTLNYEDASGGSGTITATTNGSTVTVDNTPPVLTKVSIASNNRFSPSKIAVGETVTLSFVASETLGAAPQVTIAGHAVSAVAGTGTSYTAAYVMQGNDAQGPVPFTIDFADVVGLPGTRVTTTTDGSSVTLDRTPPILTSVTIASSSAGQPSKATAGDTVDLTFTSNEVMPWFAVNWTVGGHLATLPGGYANLHDNTWVAHLYVKASDVSGPVGFTINFEDPTGNGATATATTDGTSVTVSNVGAPVVSPPASSGGHVGDSDGSHSQPVTPAPPTESASSTASAHDHADSEKDAPTTDSTRSGDYASASATAATPTIDVDKGMLTPPTATPACVTGTRIKGASSSTVYYCGRDGKRHSFPNQHVYDSWFNGFADVVTLSDDKLAKVMLGENVTYRPGVRMIKIQSDPKVYAISRGGLLRWVTSEDVATKLYGSDWNKKIDDVSDALFFNYKVGDPIN